MKSFQLFPVKFPLPIKSFLIYMQKLSIREIGNFLRFLQYLQGKKSFLLWKLSAFVSMLGNFFVSYSFLRSFHNAIN